MAFGGPLASAATNIGLGGILGAQQYKQDIAEGKSVYAAGTDAAGQAFLTAGLGVAGGMLLPLVPSAVVGAIKWAHQSSINTRARTMPFSHRFEHNARTSQMQEYAMSRIMGDGGLGSEASQLMGRYGRN
jgi:hypothetical protein